ncbi:MAG: hypothetical protein JXL84_15490 [Deltaproteobacteria bacterium]|nr:hypothetical protein [Deltaproteobacteria bacterium]
MADLANLKAGVPAASPSERIWGVQKKERTGDRNPQNGRKALKRESGNVHGDDDTDRELEREGPYQPDEDFGYGTRKLRKRLTRRVDVVI